MNDIYVYICTYIYIYIREVFQYPTFLSDQFIGKMLRISEQKQRDGTYHCSVS